MSPGEHYKSALDSFNHTCGREGMELYTDYLIYGYKAIFLFSFLTLYLNGMQYF